MHLDRAIRIKVVYQILPIVLREKDRNYTLRSDPSYIVHRNTNGERHMGKVVHLTNRIRCLSISIFKPFTVWKFQMYPYLGLI